MIYHFHFAFSAAMDDAISQYASCTQNLSSKYSSLFKKEYQTFGKAVINVATSFNLHQTNQNKNLSQAIKQTGKRPIGILTFFIDAFFTSVSMQRSLPGLVRCLKLFTLLM